MKITRKISAAALAGVLTIGGTTAVFAADGSNNSDVKQERIAKLCEHKDEIVPKLTDAQTKITQRIATLTAREAQATENGHDRIAKRVEKRITRLDKVLERVTKRLEQAPAWIAEHCS